MRFLAVSHIKKHLKAQGKRTSKEALLAISGHVQQLLDRAAKNTPMMTVKADDVFPNGAPR